MVRIEEPCYLVEFKVVVSSLESILEIQWKSFRPFLLCLDYKRDASQNEIHPRDLRKSWRVSEFNLSQEEFSNFLNVSQASEVPHRESEEKECCRMGHIGSETQYHI